MLLGGSPSGGPQKLGSFARGIFPPRRVLSARARGVSAAVQLNKSGFNGKP